MFGELRCHNFRYTFAHNENLIRDAQLLNDGLHQVAVFVTQVDVHHNAVLQASSASRGVGIRRLSVMML